MDELAVPPIQWSSAPKPPVRSLDLREVAESFEAVFLAEMLSHTGLGPRGAGFGGGAGEEAFSSLLTREWAQMMAEQGGIGLADKIEAAMRGYGAGDV